MTRVTVTYHEALARLREGNERYVANVRSIDALVSHTRRAELAVNLPSPFAIVLGCSDARAPAEIIFDQGLGDLFIVRVAGNIVAPSQVASVEFAASRYGTQLVVVLGHTQCGAIQATIDELQGQGGVDLQNLKSIVDRIKPAVQALISTDLARDRTVLIREAVRANVRMSTHQLRHGSQLLEKLVAQGKLCIVGGEYSLESGRVELFDGVPDA